MDRKKKHSGGAEKQRTKKLKSLEVEAAKCAKLTDLFGAVVTTPAAAGAAPGDERGGPGQTQQREPVVILSMTDDERVDADMEKSPPGKKDECTIQKLRKRSGAFTTVKEITGVMNRSKAACKTYYETVRRNFRYSKPDLADQAAAIKNSALSRQRRKRVSLRLFHFSGKHQLTKKHT
ncbi:hypothetical protein ABVT39_004297 [Epinephelus coioides]